MQSSVSNGACPDDPSLDGDVPLTWEELTDEACLGLYLWTRDAPDDAPPRRFRSIEQVIEAFGRDEIRACSAVRIGERISSAGRALVRACIPPPFDTLLGEPPWGRATFEEILVRISRQAHVEIAAKTRDALETLGREAADRSGQSLSMDDLALGIDKSLLLRDLYERARYVLGEYVAGRITDGERYNHLVDEGSGLAARVNYEARVARGAADPLLPHRQSTRTSINDAKLRGMFGGWHSPAGAPAELPIIGSYIEGLSAVEYFFAVSSSAADRADSRTRTALAESLLRDLGAILHEVRVVTRDCGSSPTSSPRDPTTCVADDGVCAACCGLDPLDNTWLADGDRIGARAASAIARGLRVYGTRRFHIC